jgi:hypothetical protein
MAAAVIDEIDVVLPGEQKPRKAGMRFENKTVHLYLLEDADAVRPAGADRLLRFIQTVRDTYYAGIPLTAFNWHLRAGWARSDVTFVDRHATSIQMHISNEPACHGPPASIGDYRADRFGEFNPVPPPGRVRPPEPRTYFTQETPDGKTYVFSHGDGEFAEEKQVVYVDCKKLLRLLEQHCPEQVTSAEDLQYAREAGLIGDWARNPQTLLTISCNRTSRGVVTAITSGSADLLDALRDSGAERFPVAVRFEEADLLQQLCGADTGPKPAGSAPRRRGHRSP